MIAYTDGSHAGTAAAMGYTEGLVQIEMRHIRAEISGPCDPYQGVQIRTIHVHLSAMTVHDIADINDTSFDGVDNVLFDGIAVIPLKSYKSQFSIGFWSRQIPIYSRNGTVDLRENIGSTFERCLYT